MDNSRINYERSHKLYNLLDEDPGMITLLKNQYITDDLWMFCIQREPELFGEMKHPSEEMCLFALGEDGRNLRYIEEKFKDVKLTQKMILTAITSQPAAICYVPKKYKTNALKEYAYRIAPEMMYGDDSIRHEFLIELLNEHPEYIRHLKNPPEELILLALDKDPNIVAYIKDFTPNIRALIHEQYPELSALLPPLKNLDPPIMQKSEEINTSLTIDAVEVLTKNNGEQGDSISCL